MIGGVIRRGEARRRYTARGSGERSVVEGRS